MAAAPELRQPSSPAHQLTLGLVRNRPPAEHGRRERSPSPEVEEDDGGECQTPRSKESRIPAVTSCPPAPKKRRQKEVSCKGRLPELELFHVGPELMWQMFLPLDRQITVCLPSSPAVKKRKCCCPNRE